ncbi:MAG: hypothetical protein PHQ23_06785 [Candidatus Wallbacteria bacterium]|nr:hypothetical protein [Candidatus Wallbacteria bacterium]
MKITDFLDLTGCNKDHLLTLIMEFSGYFPEPVPASALAEGSFPKADAAMLSMLTELSAACSCSNDQLHAICRRAADSRSRKRQMVPAGPVRGSGAADQIMAKLDRLLHYNRALRKDSENLQRENAKIREMLDTVIEGRRQLDERLKEKEEQNRLQSKRMTQLASVVLNLKRENQDLRSCVEKVETRMSSGTQHKSANKIEAKLAELEQKHSSLISQLQNRQDNCGSIRGGIIARLWRWFNQPVYEDNFQV